VLKSRVWFHRTVAFLWLAFGLISFWQGWQELIALVWFASVYANLVGHWSAAEAADDHTITDHLDGIERKLNDILELRSTS